MKKKLIQRSLMGIPIGIAIGSVISILCSLGLENGAYLPCDPELVRAMGTELNAVAFQTVLCGLLGMAYAASSIIWEIDRWSIAKQTGLYFLILAAVMMPIAYIAHWMEHSIKGFLVYFGIFLVLFILIWLALYLMIRRNIKKMNEKLN